VSVPDLDYASVNALTLNGGTIVDQASNQAANLTLPAPGAAGSLGANKNIVINASTPTDAGMTNTMPDVNDPSWVAGANGLKTWDVVTGTGTPVTASSSITVFYTGWLASDGTQFDARRSPSAPITFALSGLIQGWQQGIPGMQPGGIRRLFVPAALAYGAAGSPPNVPANADLVFELKLISTT
jgi:FKBP-type peptidyl-prolyl cis-trans isomerase